MPAENLEEEGLPKNPDLELAQVRPYWLACLFVGNWYKRGSVNVEESLEYSSLLPQEIH